MPSMRTKYVTVDVINQQIVVNPKIIKVDELRYITQDVIQNVDVEKIVVKQVTKPRNIIKIIEVANLQTKYIPHTIVNEVAVKRINYHNIDTVTEVAEESTEQNTRYIDRNVIVPKEVVKNVDVYRTKEVPKRVYKDFIVDREVAKYVDREVKYKVDRVKKAIKYVDVPYTEERPRETVRYVDVEKLVEVAVEAKSNGNSTGEDCISQKEFINIWNLLMKVNPD